jgi:hypothetical protein
MTDHDIIDRIDELVDDQLSRYPQRTGYDHNAAVQICPHCDDEWHGLPITKKMRKMRAHYCGCPQCVDQLAAYRSTEDDSPVWCPGSEFIGPWATPDQLKRIRKFSDISEMWPQLSNSLSEMFEQLRTQVTDLPRILEHLQKVLPAPSHEPPMWANNPTRTRRTRNR